MLSVDGIQHSFILEGMWRSDAAPRIGMTAEVTFDGERVESVRAVAENQLAKEQAELALQHGSDIAHRLKEKFGLPAIIAFAVLIIGWFFLTSIEVGRGTIDLHITFWQLLHVLGSVNALQGLAEGALASNSVGFYGLLALISLGSPFLSFVWHDRRAALGGLLPLIMMLLVAALVANGLHEAAQQASRALGLLGTNAAAQKMMEAASAEFMEEFRLGAGIYLSAAASAYFAFIAVKKYLVAGA